MVLDGPSTARISQCLMQVIDCGHDQPLSLINLVKVLVAILSDEPLDIALDVPPLFLFERLIDVEI